MDVTIPATSSDATALWNAALTTVQQNGGGRLTCALQDYTISAPLTPIAASNVTIDMPRGARLVGDFSVDPNTPVTLLECDPLAQWSTTLAQDFPHGAQTAYLTDASHAQPGRLLQVVQDIVLYDGSHHQWVLVAPILSVSGTAVFLQERPPFYSSAPGSSEIGGTGNVVMPEAAQVTIIDPIRNLLLRGVTINGDAVTNGQPTGQNQPGNVQSITGLTINGSYRRLLDDVRLEGFPAGTGFAAGLHAGCYGDLDRDVNVVRSGCANASGLDITNSTRGRGSYLSESPTGFSDRFQAVTYGRYTSNVMNSAGRGVKTAAAMHCWFEALVHNCGQGTGGTGFALTGASQNNRAYVTAVMTGGPNLPSGATNLGIWTSDQRNGQNLIYCFADENPGGDVAIGNGDQGCALYGLIYAPNTLKNYPPGTPVHLDYMTSS